MSGVLKQVFLAVGIWLFAVSTCFAQGPLDSLISEQENKFCGQLKDLPIDACQRLFQTAIDSLKSGNTDEAALTKTITEQLTTDPVYANSALAAAFGNNVPLDLSFQTMDAENGESVIGLTYSILKNLKKNQITPSKHWNKSLAIDFDASGTLTQDRLTNPRNFLETRFTLYGSYTTRIPPQDPDFGNKLTQLAFDSAQCDAGDPNTEQCRQANQAGVDMLNSTTKFLKAFQRYKVGIDAGYESDQSFKATHRKISAFVFAQYESWGSDTMFSALNITPAVRLGIDTIDPNDQTPRAIMGDDSSFYRVSGEFSAWMPISNVSGIPLAVTYNYRYLLELGASEIVKNANMDSYHMNTWGLAAPNGLFLSHSSGRLPFDDDSENVVALGWKAYF